MTMISLPLPVNILHTQPQTLEFDKIATFIGGNGSGKSTILKSIFDEKLNGTSYQNYKIVCFSSGQNESYSNNFSEYLNTERAKKKALNLDCFYYDKLWSMLLIFLATASNHEGLVRTFLKQNNYVIENEFDEDKSTKLSFNVKVDKSYTNLVKQALEDEAKGESDIITNKAYHRTLHNFINSLITDGYKFEKPLKQQSIQLNQDVLSSVSFETDEYASFDSMVMFFTQAADNDYFIIKDSFNLTFTKVKDDEENKILGLEELSDGEYQLLFLYALIDLFDTSNTLFLLDEADSHLHYKNIDKLWNVFNKTQGAIITTTHLLDSIAKAGPNNLRVIENGKVDNTNSPFKLIQRLETLSDLEAAQYKVVSMYKYIVVMDHVHDWEIFKLLVRRKLITDADSEKRINKKLSEFICVSVSSGYRDDCGNINMFGDNKINWLKNYERALEKLQSKAEKVFMICDRDDFPISLLGTPKCRFLPKIKNFTPKNPKNKKKEKSNILSETALLAWRRREIKHYLLSFTSLGDDCTKINEHLLEANRLKQNVNGDVDIRGKFNDSLARLKSKPIKELVDSRINVDGEGFCIRKAQTYVNTMPKEEISDDIIYMYNYLVGENE
ncbi:MAG: ATP-binding protein [Bacteroidetes bacterium]|nr:ATP-binding protein [Bacteroidota bacterium]